MLPSSNFKLCLTTLLIPSVVTVYTHAQIITFACSGRYSEHHWDIMFKTVTESSRVMIKLQCNYRNSSKFSGFLSIISPLPHQLIFFKFTKFYDNQSICVAMATFFFYRNAFHLSSRTDELFV